MDDETSADVVDQMEGFVVRKGEGAKVVRKVEDASKEIVAQLRLQTWLIGTIGTVIVVFGFVIPVIMALAK